MNFPITIEMMSKNYYEFPRRLKRTKRTVYSQSINGILLWITLPRLDRSAWKRRNRKAHKTYNNCIFSLFHVGGRHVLIDKDKGSNHSPRRQYTLTHVCHVCVYAHRKKFSNVDSRQ